MPTQLRSPVEPRPARSSDARATVLERVTRAYRDRRGENLAPSGMQVDAVERRHGTGAAAVCATDVLHEDPVARGRPARGRLCAGLQFGRHFAPSEGITPQVLRVGAGGIASRTPSQPAFPPAPLVSFVSLA